MVFTEQAQSIDAGRRIPPHMLQSIERYLVSGIPTGIFLTAVLSNDLKEACGRADADNRKLLFEYVSVLYNFAPSGSWGSPENVASWLRSHEDTRAA